MDSVTRGLSAEERDQLRTLRSFRVRDYLSYTGIRCSLLKRSNSIENRTTACSFSAKYWNITCRKYRNIFDNDRAFPNGSVDATNAIFFARKTKGTASFTDWLKAVWVFCLKTCFETKRQNGDLSCELLLGSIYCLVDDLQWLRLISSRE